MKLVKAIFKDGVLSPAEPFPPCVKREFNGTHFVCYESADEIMGGGAEYVQAKPEAKPLKYAWLRNQISRLQGFFIRLAHKIKERFQK